MSHGSSDLFDIIWLIRVCHWNTCNTREIDQSKILTDKVCGKSKNIVDQPIVLNIYSHTCPDLTLVDLPGITRIPMANSD
jgi:hypothetical protein